MRVKQIMNRHVIHCSTATPVPALAAMMKQHDVGLIPLVYEKTMLLAGVVTDRDLCLRVLASKDKPEKLLARQCMSSGVLACKPDDTVDSVLHKMAEHQLRRLPVLENGLLAGMITLGDIIRGSAASQARIMATLRRIYVPPAAHKIKAA